MYSFGKKFAILPEYQHQVLELEHFSKNCIRRMFVHGQTYACTHRIYTISIDFKLYFRRHLLLTNSNSLKLKAHSPVLVEDLQGLCASIEVLK